MQISIPQNTDCNMFYNDGFTVFNIKSSKLYFTSKESPVHAKIFLTISMPASSPQTWISLAGTPRRALVQAQPRSKHRSIWISSITATSSVRRFEMIKNEKFWNDKKGKKNIHSKLIICIHMYYTYTKTNNQKIRTTLIQRTHFHSTSNMIRRFIFIYSPQPFLASYHITRHILRELEHNNRNIKVL